MTKKKQNPSTKIMLFTRPPRTRVHPGLDLDFKTAPMRVRVPPGMEVIETVNHRTKKSAKRYTGHANKKGPNQKNRRRAQKVKVAIPTQEQFLSRKKLFRQHVFLHTIYVLPKAHCGGFWAQR